MSLYNNQDLVPDAFDINNLSKDTLEILKSLRDTIDDDSFKSIISAISSKVYERCPVRLYSDDKSTTYLSYVDTVQKYGEKDGYDYYLDYLTLDDLYNKLMAYNPVEFDKQNYIHILYNFDPTNFNTIKEKFNCDSNASLFLFNDGSIYVDQDNLNNNSVLNVIPQEYHLFMLGEISKFINNNKTSLLNQVIVDIDYIDGKEIDNNHLRVRKFDVKSLDNYYWHLFDRNNNKR